MNEDAGGWKKKLKALGLSRARGGASRRRTDTRRVETGRDGEDLAAAHLAARGLKILDRNVRFGDGEIDLVAEEGEFLVFVEVRRRRTAGAGTAAESVTPRKRARIVRAARRWLARRPRRAAGEIRFDVVALDGEPAVVEWIRGAFDGT